MDDKIDYTLLKQIVNDVDPVGLIDFDTPESLSEYDPELREILKEDISLLSSEQLGQRIYEVFVMFFNKELVGKRERYDLIADKFFAKKNEEKRGKRGNHD